MESAIPCKVQILGHRKTCGECKIHTRRSKYACIVEAHESTRKCFGKIQPKDHEDCHVWKGVNSLIHCDFVHKFILMLLAMKIPDAKLVLTKSGKSSKICWHGNRRKSGAKKKSFKRNTKSEGQFILPRDNSGSCAVFYGARFVSVKNGGRSSYGC